MISIIIPTFKRIELFRHGIESLSKQILPKDTEIIVLNDGIEDETQEIAKQINARYIFTGQRNKNGVVWRCQGKVVNIGVKQAHGDILVFISSGIYLVQSNLIERLVEPTKNNYQTISIPTGYDDVNKEFLKALNFNVLDWNTFNKKRLVNLCTDYPFCMAMSKQIFMNVNGYDEDFQNGYAYDDTNLMLRLRNNGAIYHKFNDLDIVHLYHTRGVREGLENKEQLFEKNRQLYEARAKDIVANVEREWGVLDEK